jgi:hypothetical protein
MADLLLTVGEDVYTLELTTDARADLEDRSGDPFLKLVRDAYMEGSVRAARWLFWAALQHHHRETFPMPEDANHLMDAAGGCDRVLTLMAEADVLQVPIDPRGRKGSPPRSAVMPPDPSVKH